MENITVNEEDESVVVEYSLKIARKEDTLLVYSTINGSAKKAREHDTSNGSQGDYAAIKEQTVIIPAGKLKPQEPIVIPIYDDMLDEDQEYFKVSFKPQSFDAEEGQSNLEKEMIIVIEDNDDPPRINLANVVVNEGEGQAVIHYSLTSISGRKTDFSWHTVDGTAQHGRGDYLIQSEQKITIPAGIWKGSFSVPIQDDLIDENDEEFAVSITAGSLMGLVEEGSTLRANIQIVDNDDPPRISLSDTQVSEDGKQVNISYQLSLESDKEIRFTWQTQDITATSNAQANDYVAVSNQEVIISRGTSVGYLTVVILDDNLYEAQEEFKVSIEPTTITNLSPLTNPMEATVRIVENDHPPTLTLSPTTALESSGQASITYTLNIPSDQESSFSWNTLDGTAISGKDYQSSSGPITIPRGATKGTLIVPIIDDSVDEYHETLSITIDSSTLVGLSARGSVLRGAVTINDNDGPPTISLSGAIVDEGVGQASIRYTLSAPTEKRAAFYWNTFDDDAIGSEQARKGDYRAYKDKRTMVTLESNTLSGTLTIPINEDNMDEYNESFMVKIDESKIGGSGLKRRGSNLEARVTINDNDLPPTLTVSDIVVKEGSPTVSVNYQLSSMSGKTISAQWYTTDDTATSSTNGDFVSVINQPLSINPETTQGTLRIVLRDDLIYEGEETFSVSLFNTALTTPHAKANVRILDNEFPPIFSLQNISVTESSGQATLSYSLNERSIKQCSFDWITRDGTAKSGSDKDYIAKSGQLIIPPGSLNGTFSVAINSDNLYEGGNEYFNIIVTLDSSSLCQSVHGGKTISSQVTIQDSDSIPTITIQDIAIQEEDGTASIPYTLNHPSSLRSSFIWQTHDGTAINNQDYRAKLSSTPTTILPGTTSGSLVIDLIDDDVPELVEKFSVSISATSLSRLTSTNPSSLTAQVTISKNDYSITESFTRSTINPAVDILWLIDDSPSMTIHQNNVANNFAQFISNFDATSTTGMSLDFNMGIITTTHYTDNLVDSSSPLNLASLKSNKNAFITEFKNKVKVGDRGNNIEKGFLATTTFLNGNTSWIRDNAYLAIIYLSNEDDFSTLPGEDRSTDRKAAASIQPWVDRIQSHKSQAKGMVKIYSIVNQTHVRPNSRGDRYVYASTATGGITGDIGGDFSTILTNMGNDIVEINQAYPLSKKATITSIVVKVDGVVIDATKWDYNQSSRTIKFKAGHIPSAGSNITIDYEIKI